MEKFALFAFNGDPMCFIHVILNALDLNEKGYEVKVIIEGSATKLAKEFENQSNPFYKQYQKLRNTGLIDWNLSEEEKKDIWSDITSRSGRNWEKAKLGELN